jgi:TrmH family RNA methyltransferase
MNGENLDKLETRAGKVIYIFGSESHGIRPEIEKLLDKKYTIPAGVNKKDGAESLNVSIAAGIVLHQVSRKK